MFRKLMAGFIALLWSVMALAAVEVNKANEAELTSIKGIGPAMSARILEERKSSAFKDWPDFIARVKGVGEPTAAKFSGDGLTVNGTSYKGQGAKPDAKDTAAKDAKDAKDTAAKGAKPTKDQAAKPATPAKAGAAS
ncbi:ComEA family DNA-binding protein [Delftia acidovorans]|uniref:Helix-hairpin-helix domain-containing protein n=1 Tax=Delftia acidovorans TaxID=80866 RepID=A0AAJ2R530_DELAC|nr:helix-hairpin-helix domain-containing protein [Delftia acidovorans]MDX4955342.1 helix-hairpin-helix domain-containing protein [Delftia acidovorans]